MHQPDHPNQYVHPHLYQQQPPQHQPWIVLSQPVPPPAGWTPQPVPPPVSFATAAQVYPQYPGLALLGVFIFTGLFSFLPEYSRKSGRERSKKYNGAYCGCSIFVVGLDPSVSDDHLRQLLGQFHELHRVKIPPGKHCGFVQFASRANAEQALLMLNGTQLGGQSIHLSWGHCPCNSPDPSMYYGVYAGFNYQQPMTYQQPEQ